MTKRFPLIFPIIFIVNSCTSFQPIISQPPGLPIAPSTKNFILIDAGNISTPGIAIRKKREEIVGEVRNEYLAILTAAIQKQFYFTGKTDTTLTADDKIKLVQKDSVTIANLRQKYDSTIFFILKNCEAGFRQGDVTKVKNDDGKTTSKLAEYSVFFDTDWIIIQDNTITEQPVAASRYHSTRSVVSGLLARGPGFQANKEDILLMAQANAQNFTRLFKY